MARYFGDAADAAAAHPLWRVNAYRYDYPGAGNRDAHELSGWSPVHSPSFHTPAYFGLVVLGRSRPAE
jgi:hypothetical protein